jgi:SAM-dependent methyltransferase
MRDREIDAVIERYARRNDRGRYCPRRPEVRQMMEERRRAIVDLFFELGWRDLSAKRGLEVGCGGGGILVELMRMGFEAEHLTGIELLPEYFAQARRNLPNALRLIAGDACEATIEPSSQDLVLQFTVFSSLLDDAFQQRLADKMWCWLRPGGGILWYDFTVNNPRNADVRGVPLTRIRSLFPVGRISVRRITLAPPLARTVCRVHPALYAMFNSLPLLRTHLLAWIEKPHELEGQCSAR